MCLCGAIRTAKSSQPNAPQMICANRYTHKSKLTYCAVDAHKGTFRRRSLSCAIRAIGFMYASLCISHNAQVTSGPKL